MSVRMLRHYDSVGLLRPAQVDRLTGYRSYHAAQLARLNRIVALKELGFTLAQVQVILDEKVGVAELHGMLRLRQAELQTQVTNDAARLAQVRARLDIIEREGAMPFDDVVVKQIPAVRVAELSGIAASFEPESIGPVIGPLYDELCRRLDAAEIVPVGAGVAYYEALADGAVRAHACLPVSAEALVEQNFRIVDLPGIERAATIVHRGSMDGVMSTIQTLARWIDANGFRSTGNSRELYIAVGDSSDDWVTELQEPLDNEEWRAER